MILSKDKMYMYFKMIYIYNIFYHIFIKIISTKFKNKKRSQWVKLTSFNIYILIIGTRFLFFILFKSVHSLYTQ